MDKPKNSKRQQQTGIKQAYKVGLPFVCPLLDLEKQTCKKTNEKLNNSGLCELDTGTNVDYRLCDVFSVWFWGAAKQNENRENADSGNSNREHTNLNEP
jgi:hypothetical protein